MERLQALVHDAEQHLLLSSWSTAETTATEALQRSLYLSGCEELQDRASMVLLQAYAFMTPSKFASSRPKLVGFFGSLEAVPANCLLLWLSLALDEASTKREAEALFLQLLQTKRPDPADGWPRRQYLALLHLYLFDVLLPEIREVSEVVRWLEETQLPVDPTERQALKDELISLQQPPAAEAEHGLKTHCRRGRGSPSLPPIRTGCSCTPEAQAAAAAAAAAAASGLADRPQLQQPGGAACVGTRAQGRPVHSEIEEGELAAPRGDHSEGVAAAPAAEGSVAPDAQTCWPAAAYQQLAGAARAAQRYVEGWPDRQSGRAGEANAAGLPLPSLQAVGGTVLGAVLLYAAYTERQAIRGRLSRARRAAEQALSDLLRMGLSVSPNPMTAPR